MDEQRLAILLHNALVLLEEVYGTNIMRTDLADELGITWEEYAIIMEEV